MITHCPFCTNPLRISESNGGYWNIFCSSSVRMNNHYFVYDSIENRFRISKFINNQLYMACKENNTCIINKLNYGIVNIISGCSINQAIEYLQNLEILT